MKRRDIAIIVCIASMSLWGCTSENSTENEVKHKDTFSKEYTFEGMSGVYSEENTSAVEEKESSISKNTTDIIDKLNETSKDIGETENLEVTTLSDDYISNIEFSVGRSSEELKDVDYSSANINNSVYIYVGQYELYKDLVLKALYSSREEYSIEFNNLVSGEDIVYGNTYVVFSFKLKDKNIYVYIDELEDVIKVGEK
jgi:hypothetical protein